MTQSQVMELSKSEKILDENDKYICELCKETKRLIEGFGGEILTKYYNN